MAGAIVDFGETYSSVNFLIRDVNGALADAGTFIIDITNPDGTSVPPFAATHSATGTYSFDYTPGTPQAGRYLYVGTATGGTLGTLVRKFVDAWVMRPANPVTFIEFADAKAYLGEQSSLQDEEIRAYLEVASDIIEGIVGPVAIRTYTERVRAGTDRIRLFKKPITEVTSITSIRVPTFSYVSADLDVDSQYGHVFLLNGSAFINGPWTAVYKAGRTSISPRHVQAVKEQLWHMWAIQRGQTADSITPELVDVVDAESRGPWGLGFLIPRRVMELLELDPGYIPGVA